MGRWLPFVKRTLWILIIAVVLLFMGRSLYRNWSGIREYRFHINLLLLAAAFAGSAISLISGAMGWVFVLSRLGVKLPLGKGMRIWVLSQLGRYIPGKLWLVLGKFYFAQEAGISRITVSASIVVELTADLAGGMFVFLLSLPFFGSLAWMGRMYFAFAIIPISLILLHPRILEGGINFGLKMAKKEPVTLPLRYRDVLGIVGFFTFRWFIQGGSFFLLIGSVHRVAGEVFLIAAGTFSISWILGFLSFFAPSGLGVREGIMALLLARYLPSPLELIVPFLSRIVLTSTEFLGGIVFAIGKGLATSSGNPLRVSLIEPQINTDRSPKV
ncbi:MAG: lysylphosphatidylglycerol synthase domain-containing protein [bacterium]